MSDTDGKKPLGLGGSRPSNVKQSFSHGRTKNVVVETKRKRVVVPKPGGAVSGGAKAAVTEYFQDRGVMPNGNTQAGLAASGSIQGKYVSSVAVGAADGVITVTYGKAAHDTINGESITLTADTTQVGSVQWVCATGGTIQAKHLPAACR